MSGETCVARMLNDPGTRLAMQRLHHGEEGAGGELGGQPAAGEEGEERGRAATAIQERWRRYRRRREEEGREEEGRE